VFLGRLLPFFEGVASEIDPFSALDYI